MKRTTWMPVNVFSVLLKWSVVFSVLIAGHRLAVSQLYAQAGLLEALQKLDVNQDGQIEPSEITPMARPYFERITKNQSKSWKEKQISIERLLGIARKYHAAQNGAFGRELRPEGESSIKPFGRAAEEPLVPDFGLAIVKYPYIQADLDLARQVMGSYDLNRDGFIDRREAGQARKWTHRNPFDDDLNKDDRISRMELTQRYARRRLVENMSQELEQKRERVGTDARPVYRKPGQGRGGSSGSSRASSRYRTDLSSTLLSRFDVNRNGQLERSESQKLGISAGRIDLNQDGVLSRDELRTHFNALQEEAVATDEGLPNWFYERDANRDKQVAMGEFTDEWTDDKLREFTALDGNGDGLLTATEVLGANPASGGAYINKTAEILAPRKVVVSEIEVSEDYLIGDLNLQLSITHTYASYLDAYLTGPDGQRIELFTQVGGTDDHFDGTIFDDQASTPITRGRPPFRGSFQPRAMEKRQPSLSHFNGKSVKGVWQLVIRGSRSDRFGLLNSWALDVQPAGQTLRRDSAPLGGPTLLQSGSGGRQTRSSSGGRTDSDQREEFTKRVEEIRRTWPTMSPEEKRSAKEEMAKRGLHPGGRVMTDAEKQRWKEYYEKQQSEDRGSSAEKKEVLGRRPTDKDGRPLSDEEIQRRKDEFFKKKQEKGKFQSRDN